MEFTQLIAQRYSCKNFGTGKVDAAALHTILEAGRLAPTAKNTQEQRIYVVQSEEGLAKIDAATPCRYGAPVCLVVAYDIDLAKAVQTVSKAVPAKATTSILECLLLRAEKEEITLTGNNLELGIETVMPGNIEEEGSIAIQAKVFGEIVRKLPEGDVVLETGEKDQATVRCKKTKYNLSVKSAEEYTCIPDMERKNHVTISEFDLKEAIRQTIFSVADTSSKKAMTGELWEINGKELKIVALDGHRISLRKIKLKKEYEPRKVIVPGKTLAEIIKIIGGDPEKEIAVYFTENHIQFEIENTRAISRLIDGEYLKVEQLLSKDYGTKIKVQKKELQECIDRASLLLKDDAKKPIILNIEENILSLEAASNMGSMNESMFVVKEGEKLRIGFNPKFLLEMLRVIDDEEVFMYFTSAKTPCTVRDEKDSYVYLVLPVNLSAAA